MRRRVTLKQIISVLKLSLFPIWCWPMPQNATKLKMFCVKLYYCLNIILMISLIVPLIYGIRNHLNEPTIVAKQMFILSSLTHVILNFIFQIVNYHHIQNSTFEMVHFCDLMKPHEEVVIQRYIDKCVVFHGTSMFIFYFIKFATVALIPPLMHQPFPTLAEYPFDVSYQPLKTIIFIQQSITSVMVAAQLCMNIFMVLLLWFASARFEILTKEFRKVTDLCQLFKCIKKHQELFKYAREVTITACLFALTSISFSTINLTVISLLFFSHQHVSTLMFVIMGVIGLSEVFMYTWSAEYLTYTSQDVAQAAFNILKNNDLIEIRKCLQIIILRSQKPITISLPFFRSELSLNYITTYFSTIFSYFTALRVIINRDNN